MPADLFYAAPVQKQPAAASINNQQDDDVELDEDDEIPMSELEDLMDEITLEEEIDDEISIKQVHELTNNISTNHLK